MQPEPRFDTIVVLGCGVERDGRPSPALGRRLELAVRAHQARPDVPIVLTGGKRYHGGFVEAEVMREVLLARGLPLALLRLETRSLSTRENATYTARLLEGSEVALLATCSWHLPRALTCFRRLGVDAVPPPRSWWNTPPPTPAARAREALSRCLDWTITRFGR